MTKISDILMDYLSVEEISLRYNLNRHSIDYIIRNRDKNGLHNIIEKIGRKFYINKEEFEKWAVSYYGER